MSGAQQQKVWYRLPKVYVIDGEDDDPEPEFEYFDNEFLFFRYPVLLEKIRSILHCADGFHDGYAEDFEMPYLVDGNGYHMFFKNIRQRNDLITEALASDGDDAAKRIISWLDDGKSDKGDDRKHKK